MVQALKIIGTGLATIGLAGAGKAQILSENKNKSGIYMFSNLINGKRYIGSSDNLNRRFSEYFNTNYLLRNKCMAICRALLKHGYPNFSLTILEYCEPDKCLTREKHYWDLLYPEYNITKDPTAPMSGRNHSPESIKKISDTHKKIGHSG
jgi:group I intron endonuclease